MESSHTQRVNIYSLPPLLDTVFVVYSVSFTCSFNLLSFFPVEQTWAGLQRVPAWCERFSFLGVFLDCHLRYTFVISFQDLLLVSTFFLFFLLHFLLTFGKSHWKGQNEIITQKHTTCKLGKPKREQQSKDGGKPAIQVVRKFPDRQTDINQRRETLLFPPLAINRATEHLLISLVLGFL